jgi:hypothetical protein
MINASCEGCIALFFALGTKSPCEHKDGCNILAIKKII